MSVLRAVAGVGGTVVVAGWVAFAVSAPRNFDNAMDQDVASLGGKSINQAVAESQARARAMQCEEYSRLARDAWDFAVDHDRLEQDEQRIARLEAQARQYCE